VGTIPSTAVICWSVKGMGLAGAGVVVEGVAAAADVETLMIPWYSLEAASSVLNRKKSGNSTYWMPANEPALKTELFVVDVMVPERAAVVKLVRGECWLGRSPKG
jgi:hypothetical protein